ncbi:TolC family protein [Hydrogenophaga sp.]|uniref:TolC family protein n=1 Tax=Hydrogenophaga sp. TaxID=1904254 RepID=UPI0025BA8726|nr:TolC family protein [Hydrogenophaga sp.]
MSRGPTFTLSEAEAIRMGLARSDLNALEQSLRQGAQADLLAAGQGPNPVLSYSRERAGDAAGTVEQGLMLSQTFDLAGRRGLQRQAAQRRLDAVDAERHVRMTERASEIRRQFHAALYRQAVSEATQAWEQEFARIEALVDKLVRAGQASAFDRQRLALERAASQARLASERAELERTRARLAQLLETPALPALTGELLPPWADLEQALLQLEHNPTLLALARRAEAAEFEQSAAARGWLPEVNLGVGQRWTRSATERHQGLSVALSVPLPLHDRQQAAQQRAGAEAMRWRAEHRLAHSKASSELRSLHRQTEQLRSAALQFRAQATQPLPRLLRVAELAYQGGESSLLELLDVHRSALETHINGLALEHRAREVHIDYEQTKGSTE